MSLVKVVVFVVGLVAAVVAGLVTKKLVYRANDDLRKAQLVGWIVTIVVVLVVAALVLSDVV